MSSDFIRIDKASLTYGEEGGVLALQDIDLTLKQGEFLAVVGPSGCGKSTLLKLISGLRPPTGGSVTVSGQTVTGPLKIVGMAFQNPTLLPWRTALENVLLPLEVVDPHRRRFRADRRTYENKARKLLGTVGLTGFEDHYPWQLSGGMQQRVSLCRALIHEPALLMLDEPFGALDTFTREELWEALQALWLERRFTTLLVTHDLQEAAMLADRIIVISHRPGRISAECPVSFPRPRALDLRFAPDFNALLHDVRAKIDVARQVPLSGGAA
ncbi:nitrate ABC transporter ATP-binding protein [Elstera cyanobacteriorum]|uniref:Nitrate ABC transporter ATP-binding protein n=1 Tax=Elstera cyanobacteriorum TaxID=2022747 RepID=A0A255XT17_9PROT|nr:ABC transporter ATP-binding protein [Elstera cyanobacteriorum]OYQ20136.1 nitrate ABC transporter ATP-binding protein [Elstera cyanobacteriorum]GFZ81521.1 nitrate ABC transporter ATP-binding protein [Elstera cyanobacteriorum]